MEIKGQKRIYLLFIVLVILLIIGSAVLIFFATSNSRNNNTDHKADSFINYKLAFYTREVKSIQESGPADYETAIYTVNSNGNDLKKIYTELGNKVIKILSNDQLAIYDDWINFDSVKIIDKNGRLLRQVPLLDNSNYFIISPEGEYYAYSVWQTTEVLDRSIMTLTVVGQGTTKEYKAKQFIEAANSNFSQIIPLGFSSDSSILYVEVWPTARGGDIIDPYGIFSLDLLTDKKEEIIFSGAKDLSFNFSDENFYVISFKLWPKSNRAIMSGGYGLSRDIYEIDLISHNKNLLVDVESINGEASLPTRNNPISPNEQYLVLDRGVAISQGIDTHDYGFHLYNLKTKELFRDFYTTGNFAGWVDNTHIAFYDYRHQSWDDQYYTLKILDINTKDIINIYTQITDHLEGAGLSQVGDKYYEFIGVIK